MSIEHAEEVLNALGRDIILGWGLPVIALNPLQQSWAAKCWVPRQFRPKLPEGFGCDDVSSHDSPLPELNDTNDIYVGISVFGPWADKFNKDAGVLMKRSPTYGSFMRRAKDNFVGMVAIMVDDVGDMPDAAGVCVMGPGAKIQASRITIAPSWKICTSPSCWQYWYLLDSMVRDREIAERFIDDLVASGLTADSKDPGMKGVSRVGRLPMGVNSKPKYREGGREAPEVIGAEFTGQRFTLTELARSFSLPDPYRPVVKKMFSGYESLSEAPKSFRIMEQFLGWCGMIKHDSGDEVLEITCPWLHDHGTKGGGPDDSGTKYFRPSVNNGFKGGFYCWHSKCQRKHIIDLVNWAEEKAISTVKLNTEKVV